MSQWSIQYFKLFWVWVSEWVSDYSLMLNQQFYSYIMAIASYIRLNGDDVSK